MNVNQFASQQTSLTSLNQTPIAAKVRALLQAQVVVCPPDRLVLAVLLEWALDHLEVDPEWADAVREAAALAEADDPEAMQQTLESQELEQAHSLKEAAMLLLEQVVDLVPASTKAA